MLQQYPRQLNQQPYYPQNRPMFNYQPYPQQPNFIQQQFTPQARPQQQFQFAQRQDINNSIPFAKSIQYEVSKCQPPNKTQQNQKQEQKKYSSQMVALIKESQELKKSIQEREKDIQTSKSNIQRLEQLIDYLEKQQL